MFSHHPTQLIAWRCEQRRFAQQLDGEIVSERADFLEMENPVDQAALDKYLLMHEAHLKKRNRSAQQNQNEAPAIEHHDISSLGAHGAITRTVVK